jgi:hypothetical protein
MKNKNPLWSIKAATYQPHKGINVLIRCCRNGLSSKLQNSNQFNKKTGSFFMG